MFTRAQMFTQLAAVAMVPGLLAVGGPAHAAEDARACVTGPEADRLEVGMTRTEVEALLDGPGKFDGDLSSRYTHRQYRVCGRDWRHGREYVGFDGPLDDSRLAFAFMVTAPPGTAIH